MLLLNTIFSLECEPHIRLMVPRKTLNVTIHSVPKNTSTFYFVNNSYPHLSSVASLLCEVQKKSFLSALSDYLLCLRIKRTVTVTVNLPTTSEQCNRTTMWNAELVHVIESTLFSSKCWWLWKEPVVVYGKMRWMPGKQRHTQQVFKVTTFYMDTRWQSLSPLINRMFDHALLKRSQCLN